jgi:hypothetical protein
VDADPRLRALYRLAEHAEGEALERVRAAIVRRRSELELRDSEHSAWRGLPLEDAPEPWQPGTEPFVPAPRSAVPRRARRPGERGFRIVGTEQLDSSA